MLSLHRKGCLPQITVRNCQTARQQGQQRFCSGEHAGHFQMMGCRPGAVRHREGMPEASLRCSRCVVHCVNLPLPVLQDRLEGSAVEFADQMARELIKMEVGSRVMSKAHRNAHLCRRFALAPKD